jgi:hypothetical protein
MPSLHEKVMKKSEIQLAEVVADIENVISSRI